MFHINIRLKLIYFSMDELLDLYNKVKYRRVKVSLQMNIYYNYYNYKLYAFLSNYTL
jgi:hypothetical protein